jgi:hypothetical protein
MILAVPEVDRVHVEGQAPRLQVWYRVHCLECGERLQSRASDVELAMRQVDGHVTGSILHRPGQLELFTVRAAA